MIFQVFVDDGDSENMPLEGVYRVRKSFIAVTKSLGDDVLPITSLNVFPLYCATSGKNRIACCQGLCDRSIEVLAYVIGGGNLKRIKAFKIC